ncbi:LIM domain-containing protein [Apodospora peruviana]|uniref:LIM domain-containing protein n=1 Tax=Apodospora peruviana TaxID=516989 RepID=A0AAE0IIZ8_9PEZI|nr:LIM domain-containing protein [Apodospora peruviana]
MAGMPRESSFMPTVKCSTCGRQVEISMMGDHDCLGAPAAERTASTWPDEAAPLLTASPAMPSMSAPSLFGRFNPFAGATTDKQSRPPQVDTSAANRPYLAQGQLTPVSFSSGSRSVSPKTPNERPGAGRGDDYFTPQIANDSPPPQQSRRPGGYGGFAGGDGYEDSLYPPSSPKKQTPSLLQRINTIAPDPFDSGRRPSGAGRNGSINDMSNDRPGTSASNMSSSFGSTQAPRLPRKNGYGGFGPPQRGGQEVGPESPGLNRSETFPRPSAAMEPPMRTPSAPGPRPDRRRRPSEASQDMDRKIPMTSERSRRPSRGPDTSRPPPPRTSLIRPRTAGRDEAPPAVPAINFAEEFGVGNPYHAASASTSSSASGYSQSDRRPSQASSRTSPPRSLPSRSGRNPSTTANFDSLMSDLQSSMKEMNQKALPPSALQPPPKDIKMRPRPSPLTARPPPPERGYDPRIDPIITSGRPRRPKSPLASPPFDTPFQNEPAIRDRARNISPVSPLSPAPPEPQLVGSPERSRDRSGSRPRDPVRTRSRSRARDGNIQSTRGDCKACGLPITGKSISSADGRLTGRYHKACFVCFTCKEPFSSATFYVHADRPYCHRHYHELNGSLCGSCDKGIEGQYLEDESTKKHHVGCFRCGDCNMVLKDGYFEVNGEAYCEKDAWRRVQQPWLVDGAARKGPPAGQTLGLPGGPRPGGGFGLPSGNRLGPGPRPRMEKRMTRLGMM